MLCSVVKHAGSGRARKKCRGKHETKSSVFPHFLKSNLSQHVATGDGIEDASIHGYGIHNKWHVMHAAVMTMKNFS